MAAVYRPAGYRSAVGGPSGHIPVLLDEVLAVLAPRAGETYVDATAGLGGHAAAIGARLGGEGTIVLNDLDRANLALAQERVRGAAGTDSAETKRVARVVPVHGNYADLPRRLTEMGIAADMVLADLGFASVQVDDPARGFSFRRDGPLDMRLDPSQAVTAAELVNTLPEGELARMIREFGEDRMAAQIAAKLVAARKAEPISTTARLAEVVRSAFPARAFREPIDPATRTFQALRIAVNDEIGSLQSFLRSVRLAAGAVARGEPAWLRPGARLAVISFHSLEDRPVKRAFAELVSEGLASAPARRPIRAETAEVSDNPRARSAKLRAVRIGPAT